MLEKMLIYVCSIYNCNFAKCLVKARLQSLFTIVIYNSSYCHCFVCVLYMHVSACLWAPVWLSMCRGQRLLSGVCLDHPSTYPMLGVTPFCSASVLQGFNRVAKIYKVMCEHVLKPLFEFYLIPSY